jgi:hypothetical protein
MLHYKHPTTNQVFAYESLADRQKFGAAELVAITDQELSVLTAPPPAPVPQVVTRFQALAALHLAGKLEAVQAIMAAPETPVLAKLAWDNALSFERNSPTLLMLSAAVGMTSQDLDALFVAASEISA